MYLQRKLRNRLNFLIFHFLWKLVDAIKKVFSNEKMRVQTIESMEEIFEEMKEFSYIMKGAENDIFLHGKGSEEQIYDNDGNSVVQQHRKWLNCYG